MIQEFWTFATDLVLALVSWSFAWRLHHRSRAESSTTSKLWTCVFVSIGLAALQGALYHGFRDSLPRPVFVGLSIGTLWSLSATAYFLAMALLSFGLPRSHALYRGLKALLLIKAVFFLVIAVLRTEFLMAILDYGSSFIFALVVHLKKFRHPASPFILGGVAVSIVAATIQQLKISPSPSFNHNDLYHVVQLVGLWLFYKGSLRVSDAA